MRLHWSPVIAFACSQSEFFGGPYWGHFETGSTSGLQTALTDARIRNAKHGLKADQFLDKRSLSNRFTVHDRTGTGLEITTIAIDTEGERTGIETRIQGEAGDAARLSP